MNKHLVLKDFSDNAGKHKAGTTVSLAGGRAVKLEALRFVGPAIKDNEPDGSKEVKELKAIISDTIKALNSAKTLAQFKAIAKKLSETIAEDED